MDHILLHLQSFSWLSVGDCTGQLPVWNVELCQCEAGWVYKKSGGLSAWPWQRVLKYTSNLVFPHHFLTCQSGKSPQRYKLQQRSLISPKADFLSIRRSKQSQDYDVTVKTEVYVWESLKAIQLRLCPGGPQRGLLNSCGFSVRSIICVHVKHSSRSLCFL